MSSLPPEDAGALPDPIDALDADAMRALGRRLLGESLIVFPVRHHSPGCAWHLQRLMREYRPSVVLVEGPRSFDPMLPLLLDPQARLPLAIYSYAVERAEGDAPPRRHAAYFPFCEYSPELIALQEAQALGVPARFIDLDHAEQSLLDADADAADAAVEDEGDGAPCAAPPGGDERAQPHSLLDERRLGRSAHLRLLAQRLGCRDHEELWEHLFEVSAAAQTTEAYIAQIAAYCRFARVDATEASLRADGTLAREAEMAWHLREALAARAPGDGPVLAVVGGFHAVVLPDLVDGPSPPARPKISRAAIADESAALIRYSEDRLDRLNGYASGMTLPAWHRRVWEGMQRHDKAGLAAGVRVRQDAALDTLFAVAVELRERHGVSLPMPALRAAYEQLLQLAHLRGRPAPTCADLRDAIVSCFVKGEIDGDGALVMSVTQRLLGGVAVGHVPAGAGRPPLVRDFEYRARRQRLRIEDSERRRVTLDLYRRPEHRVTSRLLHGLTLLGVPFAARTGGPDFVAGLSLDRLQEHWDYAWNALSEGTLIEAAVHGVTVPLAVASRFGARVDSFQNDGQSADARRGASLMVHACVLGLHDHLPRLGLLMQQTVAGDPSFESVAQAAGTLGLLWESREPLEARDAPELPPLLRAAYERAAFLARDLQGVPGDGTSTVGALTRLRELLVSQAGAPLDASLFWSAVETLHGQHESPLIRGACAGLLYAAGRLADDALGVAAQGHLDGLAQPRDAVAFVRGLLMAARETAWQQPALLKALDASLARWEEADFLAVLPELRLAFADMTPKETDRIAEAVGALHGGASLGPLVRHDLSAETLQEHLAMNAVLAEVLAEDGLQDWMRA